MMLAEQRAKAAAYARQWRAEHRDHLRTYRGARYQSNAEQERARALDRYHANHDTIRAQRKARYAAKEKPRATRSEAERIRHREYERVWYQQNRARVGEARRQRRATNPEPYRESERKRYPEKYQAWLDWTRRNPDKIADYNGRRRARLANVRVEPISVEAIYARDGRRCGLCQEPVSRKDFSLDHIVPLALGGDHVATNLQTAHRSCNSRKGARRLVA